MSNQINEFYQDGQRYREMTFRAVGVTFNNEDGRSRQGIIKELSNDDKLLVARDEIDGYPYAVSINTTNEEILGFVPEGLNQLLAKDLDSDACVQCSVVRVEGGPSLGLLHVGLVVSMIWEAMD